MSESMLERMAFAMHKRTAEHYGDPAPVNPDLTLTKLLAQAVLDALMVPVDEMIMAGRCATSADLFDHNVLAVWQAMLQAAKEGK